MSERVQRVLDGELPPDRLGPAERAELLAMEEAVDGALAGLRAEREPDVRDAVMARVAGLPKLAPEGRRERFVALRRWWDGLWRPRAVRFTLRPVTGLALAAGMAALILAPWAGLERGSPAPAGAVAGSAAGPAGGPSVAASPVSSSGGPSVLVHFRLEAGDARTVELAGDFTGWAPRYTLSEVEEGVWSVVVPVEPGVHQYGFVVDGRWMVDPWAPRVDDGFGGANSRLDVLAPVQSEL